MLAIAFAAGALVLLPLTDPGQIVAVTVSPDVVWFVLLGLLGAGLSDLVPADMADRAGDLLDPKAQSRAAAERATDAIRARFGDDAILKGRALR